jgi:gliding motility-associated-like protein
MNQKFLLIYLAVCALTISAYATDPTSPEFKIDHKFILNEGQISEGENAPSDIRYYLQRGLMTVYFLEDRVSYVLRNPHNNEVIKSRIDLSFGSTSKPQVYGLGERKSNIKYYTLNCPEGMDAKDYEKIVYEGVYENIDLVYYFDDQGSMKYDFIVHPGGDPEDIKVTYDGNIGLNVNDDGKLIVKSTAGELNDAAPYTYLKNNNEEVSSEFILHKDNTVGFNIGAYDKSKILVIDPEVKWSTFYGGESFDDGIGSSTDANGNLYIVGQTFSLQFPDITTGWGNGERGDIVLGKFSPEGDHLWTIYYGGDAESKGKNIAFDESGNVYAVGFTRSKFLPNPEDPASPIEASGNEDIILLKVNLDGAPVRVKTYGSFNGQDVGEDIEYDNNGLYVTGFTSTSEAEFPTTPGVHQMVKNEDVDAFLMRIDENMDVIWSTYLGGSKGDEAYGLAVDSNGDPYIAGATSSSDLLLASNSFTPGANEEATDAFAAKFNKADGTLNWLRYFGGTQKDIAEDIVAYQDDLIYIAGETASTDLEIVGNDTLQTHQPTFQGGAFDGFIFQLDANTGAPRWSSYLGGSGDDRILAVITTEGAEAIVTGYTESQNFPTTNNDDAVRASFQGGEEDAFLSIFSDAGDVRYSGYIGGSNIDVGRNLSYHTSTANLYVVGRTRSADFPTVDAYQPTYNGGADIFIYTINAFIPRAEPIDTTIIGEEPTDTIPAVFCNNVRNNVISLNPRFDEIFSGQCVDQIPDEAVIFYGTTPRILDGGDFNYLYQISPDEFVTFQNIRNEDGRLAMGQHLRLSDIDLSRYPPGIYWVRRLVITEACVDGSGEEVMDYEDFTFAFADFTVQANCAGQEISLTDASEISGTSIVSYTYTVTVNGNTETFTEANPTIGPYDASTAEITLDIESDEGCFGTTTRTVNLNPVAQASFTGPDQGCTGFEQQFTNTSTSGASDPIVTFEWDFGNGMVSNEENPTVVFQQAATNRTVSLTITTASGCTSTSSEVINVFQGPVADAGADARSCGPTFELNATPSVTGSDTEWSLLSGAGSATFGDASAANSTVTVDQFGSYRFVWTENNNGCVDTDTVNITFFQGPEAGFEHDNEVNDNILCLNFPVQFTSISTSDANDPIVSYAYDFGGGITSNEENPVVEFTSPGARTITLTVTTESGCTDQFSMSFTADQVLESPTVDAGQDREIARGTVIQLEPTVTFPTGQELLEASWTSNPVGAFDQFDPTRLNSRAGPDEDSYLTLLITSNRGCKGVDSLFVNIDEDAEPPVPSIFTPNGDGFNDEFIIPSIEDFPNAVVKIYNRWGSLVYHSNNYFENPWDGTYKGEQAPSGVYFYVITFPVTGRNEIEGTITLLR